MKRGCTLRIVSFSFLCPLKSPPRVYRPPPKLGQKSNNWRSIFLWQKIWIQYKKRVAMENLNGKGSSRDLARKYNIGTSGDHKQVIRVVNAYQKFGDAGLVVLPTPRFCHLRYGQLLMNPKFPSFMFSDQIKYPPYFAEIVRYSAAIFSIPLAHTQ